MKKKKTCIMGIDPGNKGALAIVMDGNHVILVDMPVVVMEGKGKTKKGSIKKSTVLDETTLKSCIEGYKPDHVFLEKAQAMPGQGIVSTAHYMCGYGIIRGICTALNIPYTLIHPATWKKDVLKDMEKGKNSAIVRAKQIYPLADVGKSDGRAEALLIAHYGMKIIQ